MGNVSLINKNRPIFNDLLDDFFAILPSSSTTSGLALPSTNIDETDKEFIFEISIPGFKKDEVKVELTENKSLKISANFETTEEQKDDSGKYVIRKEFVKKSFSREFRLPDNVDLDKIKATQEDGVLKVTISKLASANPQTKTITVE